jgi:hypothetical protein
MNGTDVRLFKPGKGVLQICPPRRILFRDAAPLQRSTEAELEFPGCLPCKRHCHEGFGCRTAFCQDRDDPIHDLRRLPGTRGGLHNQCRVERRRNEVAFGSIGKDRGHASLRISSTWIAIS